MGAFIHSFIPCTSSSVWNAPIAPGGTLKQDIVAMKRRGLKAPHRLDAVGIQPSNGHALSKSKCSSVICNALWTCPIAS